VRNLILYKTTQGETVKCQGQKTSKDEPILLGWAEHGVRHRDHASYRS